VGRSAGTGGGLRSEEALDGALEAQLGREVLQRRLVPVNAEAPLSLWAGDRDEAALKEVASELGLKGPVQRLLAAQATTGTG
jgi:hypothetical protein